MSYLDKESFMTRLREKIGEDTSDDTISLIEDASDTYDELVRRSEGQEDWKTRYEENDAAWRKKYTERFFSTPEEAKRQQEEQVKEDGEKRTFDELFTEREG